VSAFADEIGDDSVFLTLLNPSELQRQQLAPSKTTPEQHRQHRVIADLTRCGRRPTSQQSPALFQRKPVPQRDSG
jgi:hypothetical protein